MSRVHIKHKENKWNGDEAGPRGPQAAAVPDEFELLKRKLLQERMAVESDAETRRWLQHAADEAAALAWTTEYPLLVWPELLEEASHEVGVRAERQRRIRARNAQNSRSRGGLAA